MRTLARIVGTALSLFPGLPAAAQDASPEPLRAAMTATARFVDPTGAVLDQIPPGAPFRVELAFESHMGSLPATLSPMAWIRDLGPSDLPCGETAAAYRATARGALGSVDLNGSVLGILARDGALTILDPERSIGAANLLAARRFDPAPGGIAADRRSGEFLFTLPDAGRVIAMTSYGSERVLAADLNRPEQILGAASGGAWVLERGSGNVLRLRDGAAPLRLPLQAEDVVATSAFPDATDPGRVVVRSANRLTVIEDDGRERVQLSASGVIAAALTSEAVLWLTPGNLHLAWLDAPDAPQTIPLDGTFDQIAVSPEGRIAVLYASRLSGFGLFDLALGRMVQAAGTTAPVAEIAFLPGALAIRLADNSTVGMMDLALVVPGKEAIVGPFPLGPAEAAEPRQRLLAPLLPEPTLIAVHPGRHTGFILDRRHAVSGKPPMEAMNLRGGVPQIVQVLNRGLQPQGAGRYSVAARLPRPGNWELVVSAGLGQMAFCTPLPSPPPDAAQLALREPGRIVAEPVATEPGRVRLRFLAPGGAPAAGLSGELDLASLAGSWRVLVPFSTDADGLTPDSYRVARLPAVVAWRAAPGTGFAPQFWAHAMKSCIVSVILGLSGAAPVWAHADHDHAAVQMQATRSSEYLALPDIPVTDTAERREGFVSRYAEVGPVLISFIYTECVEACSMVRAIMGMVDQEITRPDAPRLRLVAVSVDPARDTPASLAAAASEQQASANWDWLVASQTDTPALLSAFGLRPGPIEAHESVYLLGDFRTGQFWRISGVPDPAELVDLARSMAP